MTFGLFGLLDAASGAASAGDVTSSGAAPVDATASLINTLGLIIPFALIFVVMYFFMIRPQKKREKQAAEMRNALQVGDEVTTSGGIVGIVVSIKDDTVVIETGSDRSKIRIKRWAIQANETVHADDK